MKNNSSNILAKISMIEEGIIPALSGSEFKKMILNMDPEEARRAKRKFRKIWRKIAKKENNFSHFLKLGDTEPDEATINSRAAIVTIKFINEARSSRED